MRTRLPLPGDGTVGVGPRFSMAAGIATRPGRPLPREEFHLLEQGTYWGREPGHPGPPHRSGRAALPHPAPTSGHDGKPASVSARARWTRGSGSASGACYVRADSPRPTPFPPPPPRPSPGRCSAASSVLWSRLTSRARSSSACVLGLPDAACDVLCRRQTRDLPVPVRGVSVHARGLRPRGVPAQLAVSLRRMWPSASCKGVGTPESVYFAAQYPAYTYPCQRFTSALTSDGA